MNTSRSQTFLSHEDICLYSDDVRQVEMARGTRGRRATTRQPQQNADAPSHEKNSEDQPVLVTGLAKRGAQESAPAEVTQGVRSLSLDPTSSADTVPLPSNPTDEALKVGADVKELITALSKLDGLGLARLDVPIPKLVVLGDQSAGKSTLIEAISGIRVPRATGTCTRCPLYIKLSSSPEGSPWTAKVLLRRQYQYGRSSVASKNVKFFRWDEKDNADINEFEVVKSKEELGYAIARAHWATLNPREDPSRFAYSKEDFSILDKAQTKFSPNVVEIHISEPGLPDLSFYDLPGIINTVEHASERYLVDFVKNLVTEFINDNDALILLTISMEVDIQVSTAAKIAIDEGATDRCIGILTKPDRRPKSAINQELEGLRKILAGQSFHVGHGYFVTKQPGHDQMELNNVEARALEEEFFAGPPWSTSLAGYSSRFGTPNIQKFIAGKLAEHAVKTLPKIRGKISARLDEVNQQLSLIPRPPVENAMGIVNDVLRVFSHRVRLEMEGEIPFNGWNIRWKSLMRQFAEGFEALTPKLITKGKLDENLLQASRTQQGNSKQNIILVLDSDDEAEPEAPQTPTKKRKVATPAATPIKRSNTPFPTPRKAPTSSHKHPLARTFQLDDLHEEINSLSTSRLVDINPKAVDFLISSTIKHWDEPIEMFFREFQKALKGMIKDVFDEAFHKWNTTELYRSAWKVVERLIDAQLSEQRDTMAREALNDELEGAFLENAEDLDHLKQLHLEKYRSARMASRTKAYFKELEDATGKTYSDQERNNQVKRDKDLRELLSAEPYQREINTMVMICSYYGHAAKRLRSAICMRIRSKLFKGLRNNLEQELRDELGVLGQDGHRKCVQLLAEDAERERERCSLEERKSKLLQGATILDELESKHKDGGCVNEEESSDVTMADEDDDVI